MSAAPQGPIVAAGCVVTRGSGESTEVLVVHRPRYDDWSLPKGKQDRGEHILRTAVREVWEETGVHVRLRRPLPSHEYLVDGAPKVVHYWRAVVDGHDAFTPNDEIDDMQWLPVAAAVDRLTRRPDALLVASALQPPGVPFVVLRHGKAVKRNAWHKADVDRPLDRSGRRQSKALIALLDTYGIRQVHTSSATRCVETVVPFATSSGLPVEPEPGLTEEGFDADPGGGLARAGELMARAAAAEVPTVVCGHRPVMPAMLAHLLEGSGLVGPTETIPTASFLVLHLVDGHPVALEHHLTD